GQKNEVVDEDQNDGQNKSSSPAAFLGREPQGNPNQDEHQAGCRQREPPVEFNPVPAGKVFVGIVSLSQQLPGAQLRNGNNILSRLGCGRQVETDIGLIK